MKDLKHIKRFNELDENLNIPDVNDSKESKKELVKKIWSLSGHDTASGNEVRLPYKNEVPIYNRNKVEKLLLKLYNGEMPQWW